ncbi:MAG: 3D domain-containing protein [Planctomycetaceae bacterium]|nr:3D domain-containing protein [Planctomycetaceae bacterium]
MRWRLYTFFLSVTAVFCFLLITAVTDYGSNNYHPTLIAGAVADSSQLLSSRRSVAPAVAQPSVTAAPAVATHRFDSTFKPEPLQFFVPHNADPVLDRLERERAARSPQVRAADFNKLRFDEHGWYREEMALVTAYCPCAKCCGTQSPGITSIGKSAWVPGLAADPIYLDYGTRVFVPGYGQSVIDDTGGAMRRHWRRDGIVHIDVRMTYHYEARQWGKKYMNIKIYDED